MNASILITQCLQNDFVLPVSEHEELPNKLHIGYRESKRLIGEDPSEGMLAQLMKWAYNAPTAQPTIINIRDWHNASDPNQHAHLQQFGNHCLMNTNGAQFVFENIRNPERDVIINASGLNDFVDTGLDKALEPFKNKTVNVGIIGVWTEAKISFLVYDLISRYPNFNIAVCSALTASSSTHLHYLSLEQLKKLFGIHIIPSVAEFANFLGGTSGSVTAPVTVADMSKFHLPEGYTLPPEDQQLVHYLYRNSRKVDFKVLDGGFSGNVVIKASSEDIHGHDEVPTVCKIGARNAIAAEKDSFERIKDVLGNNAPSIVEYMETTNRAGIKYRYASMFDEGIRTFQKYFGKTESLEKITYFLDIVFNKQLGRFYKAASFEKIDLLEYYDFNPKYANSVKNKVALLAGNAQENNKELELYGTKFYNVADFYVNQLPNLNRTELVHSHYMSYVHGDLNGANIIIDAQENVWLIDFFHTHRGHILKDLMKLENDILYIFTQVNNANEWKEACTLVDALINVDDLKLALPPKQFTSAGFNKTYQTISYLRSLYERLIDTDRNPYQLWLGLLRYSVHTMSFDECNTWQKQLAMYASGQLAKKINDYKDKSDELRIDYLQGFENKIGMTILPGRKDRNRKLEADIKTLTKEKISTVVTLITNEELARYGVPDLAKAYKAAGIELKQIQVVDQGIPTQEEMKAVTGFIHAAQGDGKKILVHCVGGIGRTGTVLACYLKEYNKLTTEKAIEVVRKSRSPRAVENKLQEEFVQNY